MWWETGQEHGKRFSSEEQTKLFVLLKGPNFGDFCGFFFFFFNQCIFGSSPGDSILPTSGPKDNWVTSFLYIIIQPFCLGD